jgi:hypothetical protein
LAADRVDPAPDTCVVLAVGEGVEVDVSRRSLGAGRVRRRFWVRATDESAVLVTGRRLRRRFGLAALGRFRARHINWLIFIQLASRFGDRGSIQASLRSYPTSGLLWRPDDRVYCALPGRWHRHDKLSIGGGL